MGVHRAFQAPCVACQPSVLTVSGAYSASKACAALAHTPDALSKALWEADRATDAPKRPACAAVGRAVHPLALQPALCCLGHQGLGALLGGLDRRADETEATQPVFQAIPGQRIVAKHVRNGPTGHMQSPQEHRVVDVLGTPRHGRHDKGGCDGTDRTPLLQTKAATQELRCDEGAGKPQNA